MAKITKVSNDVEHQIIIGAITNDSVLDGIVPMVGGNRYDELLFRSPSSKIIYKWCRDYHQHYRKAPHEYIQEIYKTELDKRNDGETMEAVGLLLSSLSRKFENEVIANPDYLLDTAEKYFRGRAMDMIVEDVTTYREMGSLDKAEELVSGFQRPSLLTSSGINPLTNQEIIQQAFESSPEPIVKLPGTLGRRYLNEHLIREGFVAFMGPEKRGKTWCMIEFALRALACRRNVAFFSVGDMSTRQLTLRTHIRIAGRSDRPIYCQPHYSPIVDCVHNQNGECSRACRTGRKGLGFDFNFRKENRIAEEVVSTAPRGYRPCSACRKAEDTDWSPSIWWEKIASVEPLTWRYGLRESKKYQHRGRGRQIKMDSFPNYSVNVTDLDRQLNLWERYEGFVPDVIVIDYADILAPMNTKNDYRHQQNETWMALRRMSQERKCLVVTATQTDAASYYVPTLNRNHFSEDKRKFAHVSAMLGLNQTEDEKRLGLFRINTILVREGECDPARCCTLLQNLRRGRFFMDSF